MKSINKVAKVDPLLLTQVVVVACGHTGAVEIIIGAGGPGAGNADPAAAQSLGKLDEPGVGGVDGIVPLVHGAHALGKIRDGDGFGAVDLGIGVGLPEGAAGNLGHFHIVRDQPGIDAAQDLKALGRQGYMLSHKKNSP